MVRWSVSMPEPRLAASDPERLERPEAARRPGRLGVRRQRGAGHEFVRRIGAGVVAGRGRTPGDGQLGRHVGDLDAHHEPHPVQPGDQLGGLTGLGVGGERLAVVVAVEGVLDVTVRAEHQRARPGAGGERREVLGGQRVQPGQPVRAGDPQHVAVREVDEAVTGLEGALLGVERAVVRGDTGVDAIAGDRAGQVEQRASHGSAPRGARSRSRCSGRRSSGGRCRRRSRACRATCHPTMPSHLVQPR